MWRRLVKRMFTGTLRGEKQGLARQEWGDGAEGPRGRGEEAQRRSGGKTTSATRKSALPGRAKNKLGNFRRFGKLSLD